MPKFIGNHIHGAVDISDIPSEMRGLVQLSYSQVKLLPAHQIKYVLNTSDKGSRGTYAKRWNDWYASPEDVLNAPQATENIRGKANRVLAGGSFKAFSELLEGIGFDDDSSTKANPRTYAATT